MFQLLNSRIESVADYACQSLVKVSSSKLQGPRFIMEECLSSLFTLATIWNAIILLDEADVFM